MGFYSFDKNRIPQEAYPEFKKAIKDIDIEELTRLHNKYKVSDNTFCCPDPCVYIHMKPLFDGEADT